MADGAVIRDFLVALGFKTDNAGLGKMQDAMKGLEWKAKALNGAFLALATGAVMAIRQTAGELDKLYFSSQRIGASVSNINAYGNAISQLGGSAESAVGSLESLAEKMRNSPGYESQIKSLGVDTREANGQMRDRVEVMKDLSGVLAKMPAYQANAYASSLGIDQNTLLAMRDGKFMANMEKYQRIQQQLGMNDDLAKSGNEFMTEYRDLTMITKTGFQVIVMQAGKALLPILKLLNQAIQAGIAAFGQLNPHIKEGLAVGLRFALLAVLFGAFFKTFAVIAKILPMMKALIGLIKILRLAILASPIGIILALAAALALLYNDYAKWKDGGKSLIDWSKWTNGIDTIIAKIKDFLAILDSVKDKVINFVQKIVSDPIEAVKEVAEVAKEQVEKVGEKTKEVTKDVVNSAPVKKAQEVAKQAVEATVSTAKKTREVVQKSTQQAMASAEKIIKLLRVDGTKRVYLMGDGSTETRTGGTVAWRNNNPGNLKFEFKGSADKTVKSKRSKEKALSDARKRYAGVIALDQWGNAIFETMEAGAVAKAKLLKKQHGNKTFSQMLRSYAVDDYSGKTNYKAYEATINRTAVERGVNLKGKKIGEMTDAEFAALAEGMVRAEGVKQGKITRTSASTSKPTTPKNAKDLAKFAQNADIPSNPHKSQVHSSNFKSQNVVINQNYKTDMVINGAGKPMEVASVVQRHQENSMALMAHNAKGVLV